MSDAIPVILKAIAAPDGTDVELTLGPPIEKTYSGIIVGSQAVLVMPAEDVVLSTVIDYTAEAVESGRQKSGRVRFRDDESDDTRYQITSHTGDDTIAVGSLLQWTVNGAAMDGETVDVFVDGEDQGTSTSSNSYTLTDVPSDGSEVQVCLKQLINGDPTGLENCVTLSTESTEFELIRKIDFEVNKDPMTTASLQASIGSDYGGFFTGTVSKLSTNASGILHVDHLTGTVEDLAFAVRNHVHQQRAKYRASVFIRFDANWLTSTTTDKNGVKLAPGLGGGSYVYTPSSGSPYNRPISGGTTETSGWTVKLGARGAQDAQKFMTYSYFSNRDGMNYPGAPPSVSVYGEDTISDVIIVPNQEYFVEIEVEFNDVNQTNGAIRMFIDGDLATQRLNVLFMDGNPLCDIWSFQSNNGGAGEGWGPPNDTGVSYRDFRFLRSVA